MPRSAIRFSLAALGFAFSLFAATPALAETITADQCHSHNSDSSIVCTGGTKWCGSTCQASPTPTGTQDVNCTSCATICAPATPCGYPTCTAPTSSPAGTVSCSGNGSCPANGGVYTDQCSSAFGCPTGKTRCTSPNSCATTLSCPSGFTFDPCANGGLGACVSPYVVLSPGAQQSGFITVSGNVTTGGDLYMANGKAIRVDGSGTTDFNIGNWGTGATGLNANIYGRLKVDGTAGELNINRASSSFVNRMVFSTANVNDWQVGQGILGPGFAIKRISSPPDVGPATFYIDQADNVGLGTQNPATTLDMSGALSMREVSVPPVSPANQGRIYFDPSTDRFKVSENGAAYSNLLGLTGSGTNGQLTYWNGANSVTGNANLNWDNANIRLGVGASAPTATLQVKKGFNSDVIISGLTGSVAAKVTNTTGTADENGLLVATGRGGNPDNWIFTAGWDNVATGVYTDYFRIRSDGNVGIGTTAPTQKLDVVGNIAAAGNVSLSGDLRSTDDTFTFTTFTPSSTRNRMEVTESEMRVGRYLDNSDANSFGMSSFIIEGSENASSGNVELATLGFSNDSNRAGQTSAPIAAITGYTDAAEGTNTGWLKFKTKDGTTLTDRMSITSAGNVGVGVTPAAGVKFDVAGLVQATGFKMPTGAAAGRVLTSDAAGAGTWSAPAAGVGGTGAIGQTAFWTSPTAVGGDTGFTWDNTNKRLLLGGAGFGAATLDVRTTATYPAYISGTNTTSGIWAVTQTAGVNDLHSGLILERNTTGTALPGLGTGITFNLEDNSGTVYSGTGGIYNYWTDADPADRVSALTFHTKDVGVGATERLRITGNGAIGGGVGTWASGVGAVSIGYASNASGNYAAAFGYGSSASGTMSFAAGQGTASGAGSVAMGQYTNATQSYAQAYGSFTEANGYKSVVIGSGYDGTAPGKLINNTGYAIMMGTHSSLPTMTITNPSPGIGSIGRVGIGISAPTQRLHVDGGSALIQNNTASYWGNVLEASSTTMAGGSLIAGIKQNDGTNGDLINLQAGSTPSNRFRINSVGQVLYNQTNLGTNGSLNIMTGTFGNGFNLPAGYDINFIDNTTGTGGFTAFKMAANFTGAGSGTKKLVEFWAGSQAVVIDRTGYLGVGDTTPAAALTVGNGDLFRVDSSGIVTCIQGSCPANSAIRLTPNLHLNSPAGYAVIANWDSGYNAGLVFRVGNGAGSDVFDVLGNGNVGIGTTGPGHKLQVVGAGGYTVDMRTNGRMQSGDTTGGGNGNNGGMWVDYNQIRFMGACDTAQCIGFYNSDGWSLRLLNGFGDVYVGSDSFSYFNSLGPAYKPGGGSWGASSDRRVKKDVYAFDDGIDVVRRIKPVNFTYNGLDGQPEGMKSIGVIAQEIQPVAPYTVSKRRDSDFLQFDPSALMFVNLNAIKDLDEQLNDDAWGSGSGWISCPADGECACPEGSYMTKIKERGTKVYCNKL